MPQAQMLTEITRVPVSRPRSRVEAAMPNWEPIAALVNIRQPRGCVRTTSRSGKPLRLVLRTQPRSGPGLPNVYRALVCLRFANSYAGGTCTSFPTGTAPYLLRSPSRSTPYFTVVPLQICRRYEVRPLWIGRGYGGAAAERRASLKSAFRAGRCGAGRRLVSTL